MLLTSFASRWLLLIFSALSAVVSTSPTHLEARQTWTGTTSSEFTLYGCRPVIFIYARETIGPGNLGFWVGPEISNRLKRYFGVGNVATEGVDYLGLVDTNFWQGGAAPFAIGLMQALLTKAVTQCPTSKIIAAGYSQGAAVTHRAVQYLDQPIKDGITAVVTFGDTQTLQDGGRIIGYPVDNTLIICNDGDVICTGTLWVFPVHFEYTKRVPEAVHWIIWKILSSYFNDPITPWWGFPGAERPPPADAGCGAPAPAPANNTANSSTDGSADGSADPALGSMTMPEASIFPSIPVGEEAPTVTVEAGSEPTEVDVDDILEEHPELSSLVSAVPEETVPCECEGPTQLVEREERGEGSGPPLFLG